MMHGIQALAQFGPSVDFSKMGPQPTGLIFFDSSYILYFENHLYHQYYQALL
jgi:hypothetical protein